MLQVKQLKAAINGSSILNGLDYEINAGEVHAIMGPNGSGKSTFAKVLAGADGYDVTGSVSFDGMDLLDMEVEMRARAGLFLAMQYPIEIPGVSNLYMMKAAVNTVRAHRGQQELDAVEFMEFVRAKLPSVNLSEEMMHRSVNAGFSGGEKKRNEVLHMQLLEPRLVILDEIDSGLDIDSLKWIAAAIEEARSPERAIILVTHYQRLLQHVVPDKVHVMSAGRLVRSGDHSLAAELEQHGYGKIAV